MIFTAPEDRVIRSVKAVTEKVTEKNYAILALLMNNPNDTTQEVAQRLFVRRKTILSVAWNAAKITQIMLDSIIFCGIILVR